MSLKRFKKSMSIRTEGWLGLAVPAVAAAAVHSTAPWYWTLGPLVVMSSDSRSGARAAGAAGRPGRDHLAGHKLRPGTATY
jgi:hypothetical protein